MAWFALVKNGFALVRPPGHHAEKDKNQGFCFFNNIAIAARYIQSKYRHLVKKILILDWDVHHGNGTQQEFYENDDVMFISIHRFDQAKFYPSLRESGVTSVGKGIGEGFNINIPWNGDKMGNAEYLAAFNQIVVPVAKAFQADILLVSAGFDAAEGDLLGEYHLTPDV
ncbi:uncharacterized protein LOC135480900 [Liolophura sinensis]|uniref:uncharacterized protein LOC135480900 n=1 Tax=Liolophura sinensis TaxID=3198878 RepID=UPI0031580047